MKFRPCIDIHNGKVKQLVGGSLKDKGDTATENFVSNKGGADFANLYKINGLTGGHIILLNAKDSPYYEATRQVAFEALEAYPGGMQVGGGINADNAAEYIKAGASHVIVTSFVFKDGRVNMDNLKALVDAVSKEHIVLDLSCRKKGDAYYVVTDRWQTFTDEKVDIELLTKLSDYCDEYLIHGVDVEGKSQGMETELVRELKNFDKCAITYAGGIASFEDIEKFKEASGGKMDFTIGSAMDTFGGPLKFSEVVALYNA